MSTTQATATETKKRGSLIQVADQLYRRPNGGVIYARVRVKGKRTCLSTQTESISAAKQWLAKWKEEEWSLKLGVPLKGKTLHDSGVTVGKIIDNYIAAGFPTRKMRAKAACTVKTERYNYNPVRAFFGGMTAAALTMEDCDRYLDWRTSGSYESKMTRGGAEKTRKARGGKQGVDYELGLLSNALALAVRQNVLKTNPLVGRNRYTSAEDVRHCREVAPAPANLPKIERWLRSRGDDVIADLTFFLAYSGLRINEALRLTWEDVAWGEKVIHVQREKRGINPWVPMLAETETLLRAMKERSGGYLLFPNPLSPANPLSDSTARKGIEAACKALEIGHVTPHGLRSYFVTRCRESGLTDADIAALIGDKTGPSIIAKVYGDVRPEHLWAQAQRIRLTVAPQKSDAPNGLPDPAKGRAEPSPASAGCPVRG